MRRIALALAFVAMLGAPTAARADDIDRARVLAQEAGDLLDDKKYEQALERAQQAEALYHAPIHTSMMAQALEGLNRYAEAVAVYEKLVAEPLPPSAPAPFLDAQVEAKQRLNALLARVPSLMVRVHGIPKEKATATIDGKPFDLEAGIAVRLDPGEHEVKVIAEGEKPFVSKVTLPDRGGVTLVEARLGKDAPEQQPPPTFTPTTRDEPSSGPSRAPAIVAFTVGALGIGVGAVTGVMFLGRLGDLKDQCPDDRCAPEDQDEIDSTGLLGNISTIGFGVGAAGVITGVVLLAVSGSKPRATTGKVATTKVQPWLGLGSAGVRGAF
jgi:hypothetical protein